MNTKFDDGFDNFAARLGLASDNLLAGGRYGAAPSTSLSPNELEDMYETAWVVGRMIDVVAADMVRGWVEVHGPLEPAKVEALRAFSRKTNVQASLLAALKWSRLYGGALAVVLIDGENLASPLELESIAKGSFKGLYVLDRWQVSPSAELVSEIGPELGLPKFYTINQEGGLNGQEIHHTRAIRFVGIELPYRRRIANGHFGASVVERAFDRILALDSATHGAANLLYKSFLRVFGVENYRQILATGGAPEKALHKMFTLMRQMQSNEGITLMDKNDTFSTHTWSFAGMYDALQAFSEQIAGATGIPLVRLLGQSPKGFSSSEGELQIYYDTILTEQENTLRRPLELTFNILSRALWGRALPSEFTFEFKNLWQPTELEKSQIAQLDAQNISTLRQNGIISIEDAQNELRSRGRVTGRFGGGLSF